MKWKIIGIVVGIIFIFYLSCYHYTGAHEFGLTYNLFTGEIASDGHSGHHLSWPWVQAAKIDTRPIRVCIASASRNINGRLVQFVPSEYQELVRVEGFHYYALYNWFSFNSGQETFRGTANLLLGHAYGVNKVSFVKVLQELGDETQ